MTGSSETLLNVENLTTTFPTKRGPFAAVNNISYKINRGEILGIVGESGCGKSVTSFSLMGLIESPGKVTANKILFKDKDLTRLSEDEMQTVRGNSISMVFQEPMTALNPVMNIGEQICEQIIHHKGVSHKIAWERAIEMLKLVGIPGAGERIRSYPHQLSGGMRQRAMIAMALSCDPELLIADEPTTALDVTIQAQILELLQDLQNKLQMSVQFITHDLGVISEISDRVMVMYGGSQCEIASSADLFNHPRHPYTEALMSSRPKLGERPDRLRTIEGFVPAPHELPSGCPFVTRCTRAKDECKNLKPELKEISKNHWVACFNPVPN